MSFNQNRNIYSTFRVFILAVSLISRFSKAYILKSRTYRLGIFQFNFVRILNLDSIDVTTIPSCVKRRMSESLQRFRGKWIQLHPATHPSSCFRSSEKGSLIDLSYSNMSATLLSTSLSVNVEAFKLIETNGSEVTSDAQDNIQYNVRFQNIGKLYGDPNEALCFLRNAHVCVIGLGGVGSWAVESLARSGIGKLTLVDPDDICVSNTNRQIHATSSSVGQFKGEVLKRRVLDINPDASVKLIINFVTRESADDLIFSTSRAMSKDPGKINRDSQDVSNIIPHFDFVVEAVDGVAEKAAIVDACVVSGTPVVISGGCAGLDDPGLITVSDLGHANGDNLLMRVRKVLRHKLGYPKGVEAPLLYNTSGISTNRSTTLDYSERKILNTFEYGRARMMYKIEMKQRKRPWNIAAVHTLPTGFKRVTAIKSPTNSDTCEVSTSKSAGKTTNSWRKCDGPLGTASFVTGIFGLRMAGIVVNAIGSGSVSILKPRPLSSRLLDSFQKGNQSSGQLNKIDVIDTDSCRKSSLECSSEADINSEAGALESSLRSSVNLPSAPINQSISDLSPINTNLASGESQSVAQQICNTCRSTLYSPVYDSHCHLQLDPIFAVVDEAIERALEANVVGAICNGVCPGDDWRRLDQIQRKYSSKSDISRFKIFPQFGLHPWYIKKFFEGKAEGNSAGMWSEDTLEHFRGELSDILLRFPEAGVGETGLDKAIKNDCPMSIQEKILLIHLQTAQILQRPVTLHCVGSWGRLLEILRNLCAESNQTCLAVPAFVLHSCNRMPIEMLPAFLQLPNVYFSFNGRTILNDTMLLHLQHSSLVAEFQDVSLSMPRIPSLDPIPSLLRMESQGSRGLRNGLDTLNTEANLIKAVPLNRLLVETDSPDQLSSMLRNSQTSISMNEPLYVRLSYTAIAKIRDVDVHELCLAVKQNCEKVYKVV